MGWTLAPSSGYTFGETQKPPPTHDSRGRSFSLSIVGPGVEGEDQKAKRIVRESTHHDHVGRDPSKAR